MQPEENQQLNAKDAKSQRIQIHLNYLADSRRLRLDV
jgi:hypothetical protein